jgi:predicted nucleotidyltransferase
VVVSEARSREIEAFLDAAAAWAAAREDVVAAAVVGSWARHEADEDSDIDLVVLTTDPSTFTEHEDWIAGLAPGSQLVRTGDWGAIKERRLRLPSGLEVEVGIGRENWASTQPVDPGTRAVVRDGLRPVFDPEGLLARLLEAS